MTRRVLLVGIGNELRNDDGLGPEFVKNFQRDGVEKLYVPFPDIDLAERIAHYDVVIFVDASLLAEKFEITEISEKSSRTFSHHISPADILLLARKLHNPRIRGYILHIRGYDFGFGSAISFQAMQNMKEAQEHLKRFIDGLAERTEEM